MWGEGDMWSLQQMREEKMEEEAMLRALLDVEIEKAEEPAMKREKQEMEIIFTIKSGTISHNKLLLNSAMRFGKIKTLSARDSLFGNCSSSIFCRSLEFLPHLESLTLVNVTDEATWFLKLSTALRERRKTNGRVANLNITDKRPRASTKEIHALASILEKGCIKEAQIKVGHHLSQPERQLIRNAMARCKKTDYVQLVSVIADNSNLFFDLRTPAFRNRFPNGKLRTHRKYD